MFTFVRLADTLHVEKSPMAHLIRSGFFAVLSVAMKVH
jgi:hypothetical protein